MKLIFRQHAELRPEWWMGHCYFDHCTRECVMAPFGLHLVIRAWWWFCLRFWRWQFGPCYLDDTIRELMTIQEENYKMKSSARWMDVEIRIPRAEVLRLSKEAK